MSTDNTPDSRHAPTRSDPDDEYRGLQAVRESQEAVEAVADRRDRLGAVARVALAFANDDQPARDDLEDAGFPTPGEADR